MQKSVVGLLGAALVIGVSTLSTEAQAVLWGGVPDIGFHIDRPAGGFTDGDVFVDKLRVHHCDGSFQDYAVNQWVDPVVGYTRRVNGGDLCSATWYWSSDIDINGDNFTLKAWPSSTTVNLETPKPVEVLPYKYSGSPSAPWQEPELHTTIQ